MLSERSVPSTPPLPHSPYLGARSKGVMPPISYVLCPPRPPPPPPRPPASKRHSYGLPRR